jgi:hypothetical protein
MFDTGFSPAPQEKFVKLSQQSVWYSCDVSGSSFCSYVRWQVYTLKINNTADLLNLIEEAGEPSLQPR